MIDSEISRGNYGATIKINNLSYSLIVRSKWYELFLPFNSIYMGHEIGPKKIKKQQSQNNDKFILGWLLAAFLSDYFAGHVFKLNTMLMGISHLLLFILGMVVVGYWFNYRKQKWLQKRLQTDYPQIYLYPRFKAISLIILGTVFTVGIAIFLIGDSFSDSREDWRFIIGMPTSGAFIGLSGIFSFIPVNETRYIIRKIKYQGREITVPELEQIIKNLEAHQNDKSN